MVFKHVMKRISHGLWLKMLFIQLDMHFLSPRQGSGIENAQFVEKNHIQSLTMG